MERGISAIHRVAIYSHQLRRADREPVCSLVSGVQASSALVLDRTSTDEVSGDGFRGDLLLDNGLDQVSWPVDVDAAPNRQRICKQLKRHDLEYGR